jgi:thiosulfate dehydrogenase [quinone] large subunit
VAVATIMSETNPRLFASHVAIAHGLLRFTLGVAMLMHGVVRIHAGVAVFAEAQKKAFAPAAWLLPPAAVHLFASAIPWVELLLGFLLVLGLLSLPALIGSALWITALVFGSCAIQDWHAVGIQLIYAAVVFLLIVAQPFDQWSADSVIRGMRSAE